MGLNVWFLVRPFVYFHTSCVRTAKALARLCGCPGSPEPSLVAYVISTIISWAGSFSFLMCPNFWIHGNYPLLLYLTGLLNYNSNNLSSDVSYGLGYCVIALCVAEKIFRDIQGVFIIFGSWRNALFPGTVQQQRVFERRKFLLKPLGIIRRGIVNWGELSCGVYLIHESLDLFELFF